MIGDFAEKLEVDYCNSIIPPSGAPWDPGVWTMAFRAACREVIPVTLIIDCMIDPSYVPTVAITYDTSLRLRWSDGKGGGEAILDAGKGIVTTFGAAWVEVMANHRGASVGVGAFVPANAIVTISGFCGTVPHPRPLRSTRVTVNAGTTSARIRLPSYASSCRIEATPEVGPQLILRGYQDAVAGSVAVAACTGRSSLPTTSGVDYVDIENSSPVNRAVVLVSELSL
jgi:hypothetical protein